MLAITGNYEVTRARHAIQQPGEASVDTPRINRHAPKQNRYLFCTLLRTPRSAWVSGTILDQARAHNLTPSNGQARFPLSARYCPTSSFVLGHCSGNKKN